MNTAHRFTAVALVTLGSVCAGFVATAGAVHAEPQVVVMPRVEVVGKREAAQPLQVVHLPRVEVVGRRAPTVLAQQPARGLRG